jgi:hypothetical protein
VKTQHLRLAWGVLLGIGAALEAVALVRSQNNDTLSEVVEDAGRDWQPLPLAVGLTVGHWFPSLRGVALVALGVGLGAWLWPIGGKKTK